MRRLLLRLARLGRDRRLVGGSERSWAMRRRDPATGTATQVNGVGLPRVTPGGREADRMAASRGAGHSAEGGLTPTRGPRRAAGCAHTSPCASLRAVPPGACERVVAPSAALRGPSAERRSPSIADRVPSAAGPVPSAGRLPLRATVLGERRLGRLPPLTERTLRRRRPRTPGDSPVPSPCPAGAAGSALSPGVEGPDHRAPCEAPGSCGSRLRGGCAERSEGAVAASGAGGTLPSVTARPSRSARRQRRTDSGSRPSLQA